MVLVSQKIRGSKGVLIKQFRDLRAQIQDMMQVKFIRKAHNYMLGIQNKVIIITYIDFFF